jgi:hypothetical protein
LESLDLWGCVVSRSPGSVWRELASVYRLSWVSLEGSQLVCIPVLGSCARVFGDVWMTFLGVCWSVLGLFECVR